MSLDRSRYIIFGIVALDVVVDLTNYGLSFTSVKSISMYIELGILALSGLIVLYHFNRILRGTADLTTSIKHLWKSQSTLILAFIFLFSIILAAYSSGSYKNLANLLLVAYYVLRYVTIWIFILIEPGLVPNILLGIAFLIEFILNIILHNERNIPLSIVNNLLLVVMLQVILRRTVSVNDQLGKMDSTTQGQKDKRVNVGYLAIGLVWYGALSVEMVTKVGSPWVSLGVTGLVLGPIGVNCWKRIGWERFRGFAYVDWINYLACLVLWLCLIVIDVYLVIVQNEEMGYKIGKLVLDILGYGFQLSYWRTLEIDNPSTFFLIPLGFGHLTMFLFSSILNYEVEMKHSLLNTTFTFAPALVLYEKFETLLSMTIFILIADIMKIKHQVHKTILSYEADIDDLHSDSFY